MSDATAPLMDRHLQQRLTEKHAELERYRPLPPHVVARLHGDLRVELTYHSNAIEGNTLTLRETQLVIEHGMTVGSHPLRDYLEATNHATALDTIVQLADQATPITTTMVRDLHRQTMHDSLPTAGQWRTIPVHIRGAAHAPPRAAEVPGLMDVWIAWVNTPQPDYHPVLAATIAHHGFEAVHPFEDGNGRIGRLLLNLLLLRAGYPPALVLREWRSGYMLALAKADAGDYLPLSNLIGRAVEQVLDRYLEVCGELAQDERALLLSELAQATGESAPYLGLLIRKGRLEGTMRGGRWYSTRAALTRYRDAVATRAVPRGRPPKSS